MSATMVFGIGFTNAQALGDGGLVSNTADLVVHCRDASRFHSVVDIACCIYCRACWIASRLLVYFPASLIFTPWETLSVPASSRLVALRIRPLSVRHRFRCPWQRIAASGTGKGTEISSSSRRQQEWRPRRTKERLCPSLEGARASRR